jgi:hypothetical protein
LRAQDAEEDARGLAEHEREEPSLAETGKVSAMMETTLLPTFSGRFRGRPAEVAHVDEVLPRTGWSSRSTPLNAAGVSGTVSLRKGSPGSSLTRKKVRVARIKTVAPPSVSFQ